MYAVKKALIHLCAGLTILGIASCAPNKDKFEAEVDTEAIAVKLLREVQTGGYQILTTAELKQWMDSGKDMLIVDTMPFEDSYQKAHIPGAKQFLFPISEMKTWEMKETDGKSREDYIRLLGSDKNRPIVVYCGFTKCGRSHNGALWALELGYTSVYRYPGGIFAWKGAKFPVDKGQ